MNEIAIRARGSMHMSIILTLPFIFGLHKFLPAGLTGRLLLFLILNVDLNIAEVTCPILRVLTVFSTKHSTLSIAAGSLLPVIH
jgi:hypothetical protein